MERGTILSKTEKGYGFIKTTDKGPNIYFHARDLFNVKFYELEIGDQVQFNLTDTPKGPAAVDVTVIY